MVYFFGALLVGLGWLFISSGPSPFLPWIGGADWYLQITPPAGFNGAEFYILFLYALVLWFVIKIITFGIRERTLAACAKPFIGLVIFGSILGIMIFQERMSFGSWNEQVAWSQRQLESLPAQANLSQLQNKLEPLFGFQPRLRPYLESKDLNLLEHWGYTLTYSQDSLDAYNAYKINVDLSQQQIKHWEIRKIEFADILVSCEIIAEYPRLVPTPHACPDTQENQE